MRGHALSAENYCSFAWVDLHLHLIHGSFGQPEPIALWYNCADMAYHYIISPAPYLHSYAITPLFGNITSHIHGTITSHHIILCDAYNFYTEYEIKAHITTSANRENRLSPPYHSGVIGP